MSVVSNIFTIADGQKTHCVLIELLTGDENLNPHIIPNVLSIVKKHIRNMTNQPLL